MVKFNPISAWISVDDAPLPEFGEEVFHADRKVTCWIPSEAGKVRLLPMLNGDPLSKFIQDVLYQLET